MKFKSTCDFEAVRCVLNVFINTTAVVRRDAIGVTRLYRPRGYRIPGSSRNRRRTF